MTNVEQAAHSAIAQAATSRIEQLAHYIAREEGFGIAGDIPTRLNNPGDLMFCHQPGAIGEAIVGRDGKTRIYAEFTNLDAGWQAVLNQIRLDASRHETLQQFINKYAPGQDGNNPKSYLAFVMRGMGVTDQTTLLSVVIADQPAPVAS